MTLDVVLKDIKNVHLSVHPPTGRVTISAPVRTSLSTLRVFAISKLAWIRKQQRKLREQERETPREYLDRESHYVWGRRCLLRVIERAGPAMVEQVHGRITLTMRPGAGVEKRREIVDSWYREQLKQAIPPLVAKWQGVIGVSLKRFFVQRMRTRWGSCNHASATIRLNTDLAKKPRQCLEYLVVHELIHLLEPTHNARFTALLDRHMPKWQSHRQALNRLPVRHEDWAY